MAKFPRLAAQPEAYRQTTPGLSFGASSKRRQCDDGQRALLGPKSKSSPATSAIKKHRVQSKLSKDGPSRGRRFQRRPTVRKPSGLPPVMSKVTRRQTTPSPRSTQVTSRSSCETLKKADVRTTQTASCGALPRNLAPGILPPLPRMPAAYHVKNGASHER